MAALRPALRRRRRPKSGGGASGIGNILDSTMKMLMPILMLNRQQAYGREQAALSQQASWDAARRRAEETAGAATLAHERQQTATGETALMEALGAFRENPAATVEDVQNVAQQHAGVRPDLMQTGLYMQASENPTQFLMPEPTRRSKYFAGIGGLEPHQLTAAQALNMAGDYGYGPDDWMAPYSETPGAVDYRATQLPGGVGPLPRDQPEWDQIVPGSDLFRGVTETLEATQRGHDVATRRDMGQQMALTQFQTDERLWEDAQKTEDALFDTAIEAYIQRDAQDASAMRLAIFHEAGLNNRKWIDSLGQAAASQRQMLQSLYTTELNGKNSMERLRERIRFEERELAQVQEFNGFEGALRAPLLVQVPDPTWDPADPDTSQWRTKILPVGWTGRLFLDRSGKVMGYVSNGGLTTEQRVELQNQYDPEIQGSIEEAAAALHRDLPEVTNQQALDIIKDGGVYNMLAPHIIATNPDFTGAPLDVQEGLLNMMPARQAESWAGPGQDQNLLADPSAPLDPTDRQIWAAYQEQLQRAPERYAELMRTPALITPQGIKIYQEYLESGENAFGDDFAERSQALLGGGADKYQAVESMFQLIEEMIAKRGQPDRARPTGPSPYFFGSGR